jgi:hypothetical protein
MRFSETVRLDEPDLVISRRHENWTLINDHPVYSHQALEFARWALAKGDRERSGTVSASSLGECLRYQQFVYAGMPKMLPSTQGAMRMLNGAFMHLRWQMEGLTEGWLAEAEVPVPPNRYRMSGTMDGILDNGAVLELKSINSNGFSRVATFGPLIPHLYQMATYLLCSGASQGVFLYECKDNQEYAEIVVGRKDLPLQEAADQAEALWTAIEGQSLYEPLEKCIDRDGYLYKSCPFRDRCLEIHSWEQVRG